MRVLKYYVENKVLFIINIKIRWAIYVLDTTTDMVEFRAAGFIKLYFPNMHTLLEEESTINDVTLWYYP